MRRIKGSGGISPNPFETGRKAQHEEDLSHQSEGATLIVAMSRSLP
jgi:hypothetical protein